MSFSGEAKDRLSLPPKKDTSTRLPRVALSTLREVEKAFGNFRQAVEEEFRAARWVPPDFEIPFIDILEGHSEYSAMRYAAHFTIGNDEMMVQIGSPGAISSMHAHPEGLRERYRPVPLEGGGMLYLMLAEDRIPRRVDEEIEIPPNTEHFVFALGDPTVTLIKMGRALLFPENERHIKRGRAVFPVTGLPPQK